MLNSICYEIKHQFERTYRTNPCTFTDWFSNEGSGSSAAINRIRFRTGIPESDNPQKISLLKRKLEFTRKNISDTIVTQFHINNLHASHCQQILQNVVVIFHSTDTCINFGSNKITSVERERQSEIIKFHLLCNT